MWKSVCCEIQGRGHIRTNTPCQDKTLCFSQNGVHLIALADGAGSAKFSHFGAETVVQSVSSYISNNFSSLINNEDGKQVKLIIMDVIKQALEAKSDELKCNQKDLASTLLLVAVSNDKYIIIHVGDGVIGYLNNCELKVASLPDNGEYANVTTFVTSSEALSSMRLFRGNIGLISGFILMSDGTEQSLYNKQNKTLAQSIIKLLHRTCIIDRDVMYDQLSNALNVVVSRNTQDDCSIALLARPVGELRPIEQLSFTELCDIFNINSNKKKAIAKKRVARYLDILEYVSHPRTIHEISRHIHLKTKYAQRHVDSLIHIGVMKKTGRYFVKTQ